MISLFFIKKYQNRPSQNLTPLCKESHPPVCGAPFRREKEEDTKRCNYHLHHSSSIPALHFNQFLDPKQEKVKSNLAVSIKNENPSVSFRHCCFRFDLHFPFSLVSSINALNPACLFSGSFFSSL